MSSPGSVFTPAINDNDHGPKVLLAGGITLAATALMTAVAIYNRSCAKTLHHIDTPLLALGLALDVVFFAIFARAVKDGFGRHVETLAGDEAQHLKRLLLAGLIIFFVCHGVIKIAYNVLASRTARGKHFGWIVTGFSGGIVAWTIASTAVIAYHLANTSSPERSFFLITGALSIAFILGQLACFLWIIWRTNANRKAKVRWTISIACFVPFSIAAVVLRLAYTPPNYFAGDWTFKDVNACMLLLIELNLVSITVLAPNLPVFFQNTSTGGVYFLPGEAVSTSKSGGADREGNASYALSNIYTGRSGGGGVTSVTGQGDGRGATQRAPRGRRESFDSDVILMRRSVEIERASQTTKSETRTEP